MEQVWIRFDLEKLKQLHLDLILTSAHIKQELPYVNWDSTNEVKKYFKETFDITLDSRKIVELVKYLHRFNEGSKEREIIQGLIYYYKIHYTIKNYLKAVINQAQKDGTYLVRDAMFGTYTMYNRQPLPLSKELTECIIDYHEALSNIYEIKGDAVVTKTQKGEYLCK